MPDLDFAGLREHLEESAVPPPFAEIHARRQRRTRRLAVGAAALTTAAVLAGTLAMQPHRSRTVPVGPPSPPATLSLPVVAAVAATPTGTLYAITQTCTADCTGGFPHSRVALVRSTDLGATWTVASRLDWYDPQSYPPRLVAGDDTHLWVVVGTVVQSTVDGGRTWTRATVGNASYRDDPVAFATASEDSVAGGDAWLVVSRTVVRAPAGGVPAPVPNQPPPGGNTVVAVTALGADRAVALVDPRDGTLDWYGTTDGGAHWTPLAEPCGATALPRSMSVGPDGTRWVVCAGRPGAGQEPKYLSISTDGGKSWRPQGALESTGYGDDVHAMSATVAWRTGARSDIYRTVDRTQWTDVAPTGGPGGPAGFLAVNVDTAVYFGYDDTDKIALHVTRDGGHTWTTRPFDPPS